MLVDTRIHHLWLLAVLCRLSALLLLPIWLVTDLRLLLSDEPDVQLHQVANASVGIPYCTDSGVPCAVLMRSDVVDGEGLHPLLIL